jgi:hypothetical protein
MTRAPIFQNKSHSDETPGRARPEFLRSIVATETEVVQRDGLAPDTLLSALEGVHTAYYLQLGGGAWVRRKLERMFTYPCMLQGNLNENSA